MKKVVCIGGGNAMPKVLHKLKGKCDLTAISSMLDSGGSSGRLREKYGICAVGDIRRSLIELSKLEDKEIFNLRTSNDHSLGNLVIAYLWMNNIDLNEFFETEHLALPSTLDNVHLCARLKNGEEIFGETNIDVPKHNSQVEEVFLSGEASFYPESISALRKADVIVIGPGDLYSSIMQTLLLGEIETTAKLIYICNLENKKGETDNFTVLDFALEVEKYLKKKLDCIIYNNKMYSSNCVKINEGLDNRFIGVDLTDNFNLIDIIL
jgi:uncharacterized cofD-like protein